MTNRVKQILILNRNLRVSVEAKRALESTGRYEVAAFTTPDAALDHLRNQPAPDAVIVDFTLPRVNGRDVALRVRATVPDALIIAAPDTPEVARVVNELKLAGTIDLPSPSRKLITVIERILDRDGAATPETSESPPRESRDKAARPRPTTPRKTPPRPSVDEPPSPQEPAFSSLDSVLVRIGGLAGDVGTETLDVDMSGADYADDNTVEFILSGEYATLQDEIDREEKSPPHQETSEEAVDIFQRLAAEEPPPPTFEEGGTVGDLMIGVGDTNLQAVVDILRESRATGRRRDDKPDAAVDTPGDSTAPPAGLPETDPPTADDVQLPDTAARHILENALDDTTPLTFSLDEFMERVKSRSSDISIKPLPSWEQEIDRYVQEPAFLEPKIMPELHPDDPGEQPTELLPVEPDESFSEAETANLPPQPSESTADQLSATAPPTDLPEETPPAPETAPQDATETPPAPPVRQTESAPPPTLPEAVEEPEEATLPPLQRMVEAEQAANPEVARMALALTHVSLEATAALTLLARDGQIAGYGGEMPVPEIELLRRTINDDWESTPQDARIRFVRVEQSGTDYVIYTRGTEGGYSLSLVFPGNLPLNNMRRQFEKLVAALQNVPQLPAQTGEAVDAEIVDLEEELGRTQAEAAALTGSPVDESEAKPAVPLVAYTFVWLVNDPDMALPDAVVQALTAGLEFQLAQQGWQVETIRVLEDYVYVQAGVPEDMAVYEVIEDMKRRSARIARSADKRLNPDTLWADSYLALMPARELDVHEIQRFIHFARAR